MDQADNERCVALAEALFVAMTGDAQARSEVGRAAGRAIPRFLSAGRLVPACLGTAGVRATRREGQRGARRAEAEVRAISLALALSTGRLADVPPSERRDLAMALDSEELARALTRAPVAPTPAVVGVPAMVRACVPYQLAPSRAGAVWLGSVAVRLREVSPSEAPVACRLGTMDGGTIELRSHAGALFRPLLAPGTWEPITVAGFVEAADGRLPWVDSPFHRGGPTSNATPALRDCLVPPASVTPSHAAAVAERATYLPCDEFLVVDGVVHRPTDAPTLDVRTLGTMAPTDHRGRRSTLCVAWELGDDIASTDDMRTFSTSRRVGEPLCTNLAVHGGLAIARLHGAGRFAVADLAAARDLARALEAMDRAATADAEDDAVALSDLFPVDVVDPSLLPPAHEAPRLASLVAYLDDLDLTSRMVRGGRAYEREGDDAIARPVLDLASRVLAGEGDREVLAETLAEALSGLRVTESRSAAPVMAVFARAALDELRAALEPDEGISGLRL